MFGYNQQQNQPMQQQPFGGFQQQQFVPQPTADQIKQQQRLLHQNSLKQTFARIYQLQNQPQLAYLLQTIPVQQKLQIDTMNKTMSKADISSINANDMQNIIQRTRKIKDKNTKLLHRLLTVKGKLQRVNYQDMNQHSKYQHQTNQVLDKIRNLKSQMMQKCAYLKTNKINRNQDEEQKVMTQKKSQSNYSTIGTGLKQLKHGVEVLDRQVVKQKTEMELVVKFLKENS